MIPVAALYHFAALASPDEAAQRLRDLCAGARLTGTLILASEGINGTIAGPREGLEHLLETVRSWPGFAGLEAKFSTASAPPFRRMKVKVKAEIVTMGQPDIDPARHRGTYVPAREWNALIASPDVAVIDTRNDYEVQIGRFAGAIDPDTDSFRDFPAWWRANADRLKGKRIAMYCTGGIRCEKSTAFLKSEGVEEVYHLQGGILKYLEEVPREESTWEGACFVFDSRVSVEHGLEEGAHLLCHGCRRPLSPEETEHPDYEPGVSCHRCAGQTSDEDKARFRERQRQLSLRASRA